MDSGSALFELQAQLVGFLIRIPVLSLSDNSSRKFVSIRAKKMGCAVPLIKNKLFSVLLILQGPDDKRAHSESVPFQCTQSRTSVWKNFVITSVGTSCRSWSVWPLRRNKRLLHALELKRFRHEVGRTEHTGWRATLADPLSSTSGSF